MKAEEVATLLREVQGLLEDVREEKPKNKLESNFLKIYESILVNSKRGLEHELRLSRIEELLQLDNALNKK